MKKTLFLLIIILLISCKSETKEEAVKPVFKQETIKKIQISTTEKNLIYNIDSNTIVVDKDTVRIENPFIYSFDGTIENKKIQVHLSNTLSTEFGGYATTAQVYIAGEEEIFSCYFDKDKNNNYKTANVTTYYSMDNADKTICKLKINNLSKPNMFLDCEYNGKDYQINISPTYPSYKCYDEIEYTLFDCRKKFKEQANREYVPNRNYKFIAEIISKNDLYSNVKSELKYLFSDSLDVKNYKKWKHQFQVSNPKTEDDSYSTETLANSNPVFIDENIFVISQYSYNYMGGAHGMMTTNYENFDVNAGKIINLNDILNFSSVDFKTFYEKKVNNLYKDGVLNEKEIPMSDKFFILPTGIVFSYAPYELLGFAAGEPHIFFSYRDLEPFIANNSVLDNYRNKY